MIIEPEGLFGGERLAACSDLAQLYWPRLFLGSNGYARLELSYSSIVSKIFRNFRKVPAKAELWSVFREYEANCLAVLYEANGVWWCQFDTSEKYLPRYKTRRDSQSPAPSAELMEKFRKGYVNWKSAKSLSDQSFQKSAEDFGEFQKISAGEERSRRGVGVGEETQPEGAKNAPSSSDDQLPESTAHAGDIPETPASLFDETAITTREDPQMAAALREVFAYYLTTMKRNSRTYSFSPLRRKKGMARLEEAQRIAHGNLAEAVELMKAVIDEVSFSDFHMGRSAKTDGKSYCEWEDHLFRSTEQFEKWVQRCQEAARKETVHA